MAYQVRGRDPLFDSNMQAAIEKRGKELAGLALVVLGLMAAAMIGSYTPDDPSWLSATDAPVKNWLGRLGASISAPLYMIVGLGSWGLAVVLVAWGLRFALHQGEDRALSRVVFAPIWIALASVYAAGIAVGPTWPHSFGMGGLFGDMMMGSALGLLPFGAGFGLKLLMVVLGLGLLALGAFVTGFTRAELGNIARFLLVGLVMVYATMLNLLGRGAGNALSAAQGLQAAHSERRARRAEEAAEAAAWAASQQGAVMPEAVQAPVTRVHRAAPPPAVPPAPQPRLRHPEPELDLDVEPMGLLDEDDAPQVWTPQLQAQPQAHHVKKPGLLGLVPALIKRADPMPEPELYAPHNFEDYVDPPGEDRIRAKIADVVKARRRVQPAFAAAPAFDPTKPLTKGRGRGPDPLIYRAAPAAAGPMRAEPPVTAAQAQPAQRRTEPPLTAARAAVPPVAPVGSARRDLPPAPEALRPEPQQDWAQQHWPEEDGFAPEAGWLPEPDLPPAPPAAPVQSYAAAPTPVLERPRAVPPAPVEEDLAEEEGYDDLRDFDDYGDEDSYGYREEEEDDLPPLPRAAESEPVIARRAPPPPPEAMPPQPPRPAARQEAPAPRSFDARQVEYELPPLHLLASPEHIERHILSDDALEENARMLESVLEDYGVKGEIVSVRPGPVVTMYELEPAPGLKASRVIGLADDIARSMSALSARVSTVPGRSVIGIELPNEKREMVSFREILSSRDYSDGTHKLPLALGKDIGGDPMVANLAKMPHLLIAGTTGSGKSVAINTMILSLLYKLTPDDLRLVMIDPKMLELSVYDGIPHLLSPVVTDPKKAVVALKWVVGEMEDRYRKMSKMGVRNIDGYNGRVAEALKKGEMFKRTVQTGFDDETGEPVFETEEFEPKKMPYIVVIVDEMADLMMVAGKEIEACIQRLAQMARASGIHLIMATQRPSVDVITGTIKANFPTRISFQVTSKIDSRTILGEMGAEQLLGMGDMLYMAGGARITRCHGPFVSDEEVEEVVNHLKAYGPPEYVGGVVQGPDDDKAEDIDAVLGLNTGGNTDGEDALYDQAVAIVIKDRKCSTSYIQRKLGIGYNKAARLVEQMEDEGVVSAANHVGKREILVPEQ
ncbi:DNA translocase FtsK 4TM domain-containing protein [Salipiger manganoxidans]|uniref:DNA translocase FtsK n=1 Tax=Salipiger marinus TaxID=555512 RepID=UPI001E4C1496|nr:DNA translocase FtsK [Salipiger manganoxidans]MCD1617076.1 DNA translocase FtsK 4TM domain-containing protein [Salipiger manganoxidans]